MTVGELSPSTLIKDPSDVENILLAYISIIVMVNEDAVDEEYITPPSLFEEILLIEELYKSIV